MERISTTRGKAGLLSCWGWLKLKLPWRKRKIWSDTISIREEDESLGCNMNIASAFRSKRPKTGFMYDPSSYAQNFDEGCWDDDNEDYYSRGFSSRYAAPCPSSKPQESV